MDFLACIHSARYRTDTPSQYKRGCNSPHGRFDTSLDATPDALPELSLPAPVAKDLAGNSALAAATSAGTEARVESAAASDLPDLCSSAGWRVRKGMD